MKKVLSIDTTEGQRNHIDELNLNNAITVQELINILEEQPKDKKIIITYCNDLIGNCLTEDSIKNIEI